MRLALHHILSLDVPGCLSSWLTGCVLLWWLGRACVSVSGLIPWVRKLNPSAKVVYRSHIEIRADLIRDNPNSVQAKASSSLTHRHTTCSKHD